MRGMSLKEMKKHGQDGVETELSNIDKTVLNLHKILLSQGRIINKFCLGMAFEEECKYVNIYRGQAKFLRINSILEKREGEFIGLVEAKIKGKDNFYIINVIPDFEEYMGLASAGIENGVVVMVRVKNKKCKLECGLCHMTKNNPHFFEINTYNNPGEQLKEIKLEAFVEGVYARIAPTMNKMN